MANTKSKSPSTGWFAIFTVFYIVLVLFGAWKFDYFNHPGKPIEPNEWGDVLAGVFSPLAFLWLIYASLSQRAELELQREELKLNNVTQNEQREEMQRQVEAMAAQAKLLEAQSAATFDPIVVLSQVSSQHDRYGVKIDNRGSEVVNVILTGNFDVQYYDSGSTGFDREDKEVFFWNKGASVSLLMNTGLDPSAFHHISVQYTRKDGATKKNTYMLSIPKRSLRLIQSDQAMPSIGHS